MCFSQINAKMKGGVTLAEIAEMYNQRELDEEGFKYAMEQFYEAGTDGSFVGWDSDQKREAQVVKEALTIGRTRAEAEAKKIAAKAEANALAKTWGAKARSTLDKLANKATDVVFGAVLQILDAIGIPATICKTIIQSVTAKCKSDISKCASWGYLKKIAQNSIGSYDLPQRMRGKLWFWHSELAVVWG